jgi:hypothetical protein
MNHNLSLYIPHVFPNIDGDRIRKIFLTLDIGEVSRVDFIGKLDRQGKKYNTVYIHFAEWFETVAAINFQARVLDPEVEAKIVYDEPWYWVVLPNSGKRHIINGRKPCLDIGAAMESSTGFFDKANDTWNNYCDIYKQYDNALNKFTDLKYECEELHEQTVTALTNYQASIGYEDDHAKKEELPVVALFKLNKAIERANELKELLSDDQMSCEMTRKEIMAAERMTSELAFLEQEIDFLKSELEDEELRKAVDAVEEQDYVEEERYILDALNNGHYLTREEALKRVREIGKIIVQEYPVFPNAEQIAEIKALQFESEELKNAIEQPVPMRLIEDVIDELLEEMEDCESELDVADCV